ncbi:hypothetical protein ACFCWB_21640 [Streptomyces bacillaris]|uniref:hypothetical protein n=1 Tax=Streptomyces bacillaris TaxID=68179 RepID=UPI0035E2A61F
MPARPSTPASYAGQEPERRQLRSGENRAAHVRAGRPTCRCSLATPDPRRPQPLRQILRHHHGPVPTAAGAARLTIHP